MQKVSVHASTKSRLFIFLSRFALNKQNTKRTEFLSLGFVAERHKSYSECITPETTYRKSAGRMSLRLARKRKRGTPPCMAREFPWLLQLFLQLVFVAFLRVTTALLCNMDETSNCLGRSSPRKNVLQENFFGRATDQFIFQCSFITLRMSRSLSRFFNVSRLSNCFFPRTVAISTLIFRP